MQFLKIELKHVKFIVSAKGHSDFIDITEKAKELVNQSLVKE